MRHKEIMIEDEQFEYLKGKNASEVIRKLLHKHILAEKPKTTDEMKKELARLKARKEYEKRIKEIESGD
jgi:hypothetical protein